MQPYDVCVPVQWWIFPGDLYWMLPAAQQYLVHSLMLVGKIPAQARSTEYDNHKKDLREIRQRIYLFCGLSALQKFDSIRKTQKNAQKPKEIDRLLIWVPLAYAHANKLDIILHPEHFPHWQNLRRRRAARPN